MLKILVFLLPPPLLAIGGCGIRPQKHAIKVAVPPGGFLGAVHSVSAIHGNPNGLALGQLDDLANAMTRPVDYKRILSKEIF